jgi:DHA1 family inner membrane transport protein
MLANVVGVPAGAFAGQLMGWRGPLWALAVPGAAAMLLTARHVPRDADGHRAVSVRSELSALRPGRLWLALAACAITTGGVLSTYTYIPPLLTGRAHVAAALVPLVLAGFGAGALAGFLVGGRSTAPTGAVVHMAVRSAGPGPRGSSSGLTRRGPGTRPVHGMVWTEERGPGECR